MFYFSKRKSKLPTLPFLTVPIPVPEMPTELLIGMNQSKTTIQTHVSKFSRK